MIEVGVKRGKRMDLVEADEMYARRIFQYIPTGSLIICLEIGSTKSDGTATLSNRDTDAEERFGNVLQSSADAASSREVRRIFLGFSAA